MIIYTDGNDDITKKTPAHAYSYENDFTHILDAIRRNEIPTGSKQPFPVIWSEEEESSSNKSSPWRNNITTTGFVNPFKGL